MHTWRPPILAYLSDLRWLHRPSYLTTSYPHKSSSLQCQIDMTFQRYVLLIYCITAVSLTISKDAERLPEGFKRIAYDSDSAKFTFRDRNGHLYQGEAGADYGILTPMSASNSALSSSRPNAFSSSGTFPFSTQLNLVTHPLSDESVPPSRRPTHCKQESTFHDILPSNLITTTSLLSKKSMSRASPLKTPTAPQQNLVKSVRKTLLPKMQGVMHNLRRSVTSIRRTRPTFHDEMRGPERDETRGLVQYGSSSSSVSSVVSNTRPRSKTIATSRPRSEYPS